jgi:hypothetical protein
MDIDTALLKSQRIGQGVRKRRCSRDRAKRQWYALHRAMRFSKLGN